MKKKLLWVASTLLVLIAVGFLLKHNLQQKRTTDGIDISHHNIVRDWNKVNVGFIYAKATEGKSHRDTKFVRFRKNAMKRNIPFGAYHFLSTDVPAKQQFQNFKNAVTKGSTTLIPMLATLLTATTALRLVAMLIGATFTVRLPGSTTQAPSVTVLGSLGTGAATT